MHTKINIDSGTVIDNAQTQLELNRKHRLDTRIFLITSFDRP